MGSSNAIQSYTVTRILCIRCRRFVIYRISTKVYLYTSTGCAYLSEARIGQPRGPARQSVVSTSYYSVQTSGFTKKNTLGGIPKKFNQKFTPVDQSCSRHVFTIEIGVEEQ